MNDAVKALPGLIKDWKTNSDPVYRLVGCTAGLLTIAAYIREQRPSEVLAGLLRSLGAQGVAEWFESGLPPFLAQPSAEISHALVNVAGVAVLALLVKPFFHAIRDGWPIDLQARGLLGSRASSTTWVLLMFAAQFESLTWVAESVRSRALAVLIAASPVAVICVLLPLVARIPQRSHLVETAVAWVTQGLASAGEVVVMVVTALVFVVVGPVLGVVSWLFATESDAHVETKRYIAESRASRLRPAGESPRISRGSGVLHGGVVTTANRL